MVMAELIKMQESTITAEQLSRTGDANLSNQISAKIQTPPMCLPHGDTWRRQHHNMGKLFFFTEK